MSATLEKDLSEVIRKNLPEHLSKELHEQLKLLETLKQEKETLKANNESLTKENKRLYLEISELKNNENFIKSEEVRLSTFEKALIEREKKLELIILESNLTSKFKDELKELLHVAFKNPVVNSYRNRSLSETKEIQDLHGYSKFKTDTTSESENVTVTKD